jgi:hypothetical protein
VIKTIKIAGLNINCASVTGETLESALKRLTAEQSEKSRLLLWLSLLLALAWMNCESAANQNEQKSFGNNGFTDVFCGYGPDGRIQIFNPVPGWLSGNPG